MIPYVRQIEVVHGRCDQVSPIIRRVIAANPGPFTYTGTGTYIVGRGEVAVIDPGPDDPAHLDALRRALDGERIKVICITHMHMDHVPLARPLAAVFDAPIVSAAPLAPAAGAVSLEEDHDDSFAPDGVIQDGDLIRGSGWTLEAVHTPGHTSNHLCYALHQENALFTGDHVMGWSTTVVSPPDGSMAAYMASLQRVLESDYATLWPTHGPPIRDPAPFLTALLAHRRAREAQVLEWLASRGPGRIADMVPDLYAAVDRSLWPAACHSVLAHMIHLRDRQAVRLVDGAGDVGSVWAAQGAAGTLS